MERQRRKDTAPEVAVRRVLRTLGRRYRLNPPDLPGSPDVANKGERWAVFVHGCYWHQHPGCRRATVPANNRAWWIAKFDKNRERDARKVADLEALGFEVAVVWECETRSEDLLRERLERWLSSAAPAHAQSSGPRNT